MHFLCSAFNYEFPRASYSRYEKGQHLMDSSLLEVFGGGI